MIVILPPFDNVKMEKALTGPFLLRRDTFQTETEVFFGLIYLMILIHIQEGPRELFC